MYQTGISLNLMSLGGVALAVGMLVDNSIVVLEAVHRYKAAGLPVRDAVYQGHAAKWRPRWSHPPSPVLLCSCR